MAYLRILSARQQNIDKVKAEHQRSWMAGTGASVRRLRRRQGALRAQRMMSLPCKGCPAGLFGSCAAAANSTQEVSVTDKKEGSFLTP